MIFDFDAKRRLIDEQSRSPVWIDESGYSDEELNRAVKEIETCGASKAIMKAKTFELIAGKGRIALDKDDIFQYKLSGGGIMVEQRLRWELVVRANYLQEEFDFLDFAWHKCGAYIGMPDFGHTSPNTRLMLSVGFSGLLERVELAAKREGLSENQREFYESCRIVLRALMEVASRFADAIRPYNADNADALANISEKRPENIYEAMQLIIIYFFMHEYIGGARVRTLGRLDVLLEPFYKKDIESGRYTKDEIKEMLKFFLFKFWCAKVPFDLPFCLCGIDEEGNEVTSEISYMIVEAYNELKIYSPKIHIRVSDRTPADFVKLVLSCIRRGNSSFVFINDNIGIETLKRVGISEREARDFVPIGCYEPAVWGVEMGCTGNGGVNLPKAVELVFTNGRDNASGKMCGLETGRITSFESFIVAVKKQIAYMTKKVTDYVISIEKHYGEIYPDPLLSCQYEHSVERGVDVYEGGAKYNNSSVYFYSIASLVDSICAVRKLCFEDKTLEFDSLGEILKNNWQGNEDLRRNALRCKEKYGNGNAVADAFAVEFADFCANLVNNKPNGRTGVFKAALFSIDHCFYIGKNTMATPDGRFYGDPLSKNLCATVGMDKKGITALINSVTKIDHAAFPTGSVLDIVVHPSAVSGDDGLDAFYGILMTYFKKGGFAMHGNVFDAKTLKDAQSNPGKYGNLQVRVCGWNAYFVNLSKAEQDAFIKQAEGNV